MILLSLFTLGTLSSCKSSEPQKGEIAQDPMGVEMEMPTPGPEHQWLAQRAGRWALTTKFRMTEDSPWTESTAEEWVEVVAGGFWVTSTQKGTMMGMPFEGRAMNGYDQIRGKYVGTWVDNFGSYLTTFEGDRDPTTGELITWSDMLDPMSGTTLRVKMIMREIDNDHGSFEMHMPKPDGGMFLSMSQDYTRIK
jgi:hypothetical protein